MDDFYVMYKGDEEKHPKRALASRRAPRTVKQSRFKDRELYGGKDSNPYRRNTKKSTHPWS